jgi:L-fuculose-phosphate aldolase
MIAEDAAIAMKPEIGRRIPELGQEAELALLCRILAREGYCDHVAGHVSYARADGTFLVNPLELAWDEVRARDIVRIDAAGRKLDGLWSVTPAITLHVEVHKARDGVGVAVHNHPRWGTIWANLGRKPAIYEQTSAYVGADLGLFDEYEGAVDDSRHARGAVDALGHSGCALLRNHGVLVVGRSIRQAHLRSVALEARCRIAWHVEMLGGGPEMKPEAAAEINRIVDTAEVEHMPHMWEAAVRRELRADPGILG